MNWHAIRAIYRFEMARTLRTLTQSIASPVLSTSLYFVVFGAAIGSRMGDIDGISYGAFIIPGLIMLAFLLLTALTFSLFGFIIGLWADDFQKLQVIPLMVMTPLTFLGGAFYSINMLPPLWQTITLFNPVVYLISGFRWSFYGVADVNVLVSLAAIVGFLALCLCTVWLIFRSGWKLKA